MWDKRTKPTRLHARHPVVPSPKSRLRKYEVIRNIVDSPSLQPKLQYIDSLSKTIRNLMLGAPVSSDGFEYKKKRWLTIAFVHQDFVKLKGPGDFYLASRVEPRFEKSRL